MQIIQLLRVDSGHVAYANCPLITIIATRNPCGNQFVELERLIPSPPVHPGCVITARINHDIYTKRIFIRHAVEGYPKPEQVLLFVVTISELRRISQSRIATVAFNVERQHCINLRGSRSWRGHSQGQEHNDP